MNGIVLARKYAQRAFIGLPKGLKLGSCIFRQSNLANKGLLTPNLVYLSRVSFTLIKQSNYELYSSPRCCCTQFFVPRVSGSSGDLFVSLIMIHNAALPNTNYLEDVSIQIARICNSACVRLVPSCLMYGIEYKNGFSLKP